jgi:uncharacterized protein (TIGR02598 family)
MKARRADEAFSLVEVVVALGIATFCLLALLGLLSVGSINNSSSLDQTTATSLAEAVVSDLRTVHAGDAKTVRYGIPIPPSTASTVAHTLFFDDEGSLSGSVDENASPTRTPTPRYRATITFNPPSGGKTAMPVRILITWPALADMNATASPVNFIGSFDTVMGLDLN